MTSQITWLSRYGFPDPSIFRPIHATRVMSVVRFYTGDGSVNALDTVDRLPSLLFINCGVLIAEGTVVL